MSVALLDCIVFTTWYFLFSGSFNLALVCAIALAVTNNKVAGKIIFIRFMAMFFVFEWANIGLAKLL
jgi:hypothetical protein